MIRPVQLLAQKGALSDFGACLQALRRTGQSECELPHILWPCAALLSVARSLPGPSMPRLSFRPSRGTVGSACGCCHYMAFSDARSAPADLSIRAQRNDDQPGNPGAVYTAGRQFSAMEPRPRGSRHETSAAKRSALKLAKAHAWSNLSRGCVSCRPPQHSSPWLRKGEDKLVQST
jgi:hypothetical protein